MPSAIETVHGVHIGDESESAMFHGKLPAKLLKGILQSSLLLFDGLHVLSLVKFTTLDRFEVALL